MVDGRRTDAWNHTANLLCMLANIHRDPKKQRKPFEPREFHPIAGQRKKRPEPIPADITILKKVFCK